MTKLQRHHGNGRMSQILVNGETIYLAGQVAAPGESVTVQTTQILSQIEDLLAEVGSDKTKILQAIIWLASMDDFAEMNDVWTIGSSQATNQLGLAVAQHWQHLNSKLRLL